MTMKFFDVSTPIFLARAAGRFRLQIQRTMRSLPSLPLVMFALVPLPLRAQDGVLTRDIVLKDDRRARALECRVYTPEKGDKLPLILFSHGFGADKTAFELVSRHVAARGYVVVHPSHQDGVGKSAGRSGGMDREALLRQIRGRGGLAALLSDQSRVEGRLADLLFVMDHPDQLIAAVPELAGRLDASRIGVGGHSFGAFTVSLLGGVTVDLGGQRARSFKDERVKCILPISGQGTGQQGLTDKSWDTLKLPMMTITGSRDRGAGARGRSGKWSLTASARPATSTLCSSKGRTTSPSAVTEASPTSSRPPCSRPASCFGTPT
uniref:Acetylhydrolase n=1 Tax=Schlesneria paludicola TaxID=360056 RepID=A0A7C4LPW6_9PLAN